MKIRPATLADADAITAIYNDAIVNTTAILWHQPKALSFWRDRLTDRPAQFPVLVAEDNAAVVGFAMLGPYDNKCGYEAVAEWSVYIAEGYRGQGVGMALSRSLIDAGRAAGLHSVLSRVTGGNTASEHLHDRLGFRCVGRYEQLGQKFGRRHDVIVYQLIL